MKTVLITGSTGMLGRALVQTLRGCRLSGLGRREVKDSAIPYHPCDLTDRDRVFDVVRSVAPDTVIHTAAYTDVDGSERDAEQAFKTNGEGTRNVVEALKGTGAFFVLLSSDYVFDGEKKSPYREEDPRHPLGVYGQSKCQAEITVEEQADRFLILRTSWLFGPGGKNFVDTILRLSETSPSLRVVSDQRGLPTYTFDLAESFNDILTIYDKREGTVREILHVANRGETTWFDFAREILTRSGRESKVLPISSQELARPAPRPSNSVLDTTRFEQMTGKSLRHWKEALRDYLQIRQGEEVGR